MTSWQTIPAVNNTDVSTSEHLNAIITDMNLLKSPTSAYWEASGTEPALIVPSAGGLTELGSVTMTTSGQPIMVVWRISIPANSNYSNYYAGILVYDANNVLQANWPLPSGGLFNTPYLSQIALTAGFVQTFSGIFIVGTTPYTLPAAGTYKFSMQFEHTTSAAANALIPYTNKPAFLLVELP